MPERRRRRSSCCSSWRSARTSIRWWRPRSCRPTLYSKPLVMPPPSETTTRLASYVCHRTITAPPHAPSLLSHTHPLWHLMVQGKFMEVHFTDDGSTIMGARLQNCTYTVAQLLLFGPHSCLITLSATQTCWRSLGSCSRPRARETITSST